MPVHQEEGSIRCTVPGIFSGTGVVWENPHGRKIRTLKTNKKNRFIEIKGYTLYKGKPWLIYSEKNLALLLKAWNLFSIKYTDWYILWYF